jgi:hypothetical protein
MATEIWVAEWFRPGLDSDSARRAVEALRSSCDSLGPETDVRMLDCSWLPDDETLTARFRGDRSGVVTACERADVPFDRLSHAVDIPR